jgi:hypothetical protein
MMGTIGPVVAACLLGYSVVCMRALRKLGPSLVAYRLMRSRGVPFRVRNQVLLRLQAAGLSEAGVPLDARALAVAIGAGGEDLVVASLPSSAVATIEQLSTQQTEAIAAKRSAAKRFSMYLLPSTLLSTLVAVGTGVPAAIAVCGFASAFHAINVLTGSPRVVRAHTIATARALGLSDAEANRLHTLMTQAQRAAKKKKRWPKPADIAAELTSLLSSTSA